MNSSFDWRDMLRFDKMIAPTFLTILYYIHVTLSVLASLWFIMKGVDSSYGGGAMVMGGLAGLVLGPFVIRLFYELLIVIFKIHTRLSNIDYTLRGQPAGAHTPESHKPSPVTPQPAPFGPTSNPMPNAYPPSYSATEQTGYVRPAQHPEPVTTPPQPIGFQVPTNEPVLNAAMSPVEQPMPNFWGHADSLPPFTDAPQPTSSVPPVELNNIGKKIPNWPATVAALIVLYAVISPYAVIGFGASPSLGELVGLSYSIKNSSLGIVVILATLVMLGTSAGGLKWIWFVVGYAVTALGTLMAFLEDSSVFSQMSKAKATIGSVGSALGEFMPQANQFSQQMAQNVPGASQFLTITFYLFLIAMLFLGYWALAGKYQERGFMTTNG